MHPCCIHTWGLGDRSNNGGRSRPGVGQVILFGNNALANHTRGSQQKILTIKCRYSHAVQVESLAADEVNFF
jgi:hypothetical protein